MPFAKILTQRSSWKVDEGGSERKFRNLSVDLDATDYGYAVGEVEAVVKDELEVENARNEIQELIQAICNGDSETKAVGKLEYYLQAKRPEVFQICIDSGVL